MNNHCCTTQTPNNETNTNIQNYYYLYFTTQLTLYFYFSQDISTILMRFNTFMINWIGNIVFGLNAIKIKSIELISIICIIHIISNIIFDNIYCGIICKSSSTTRKLIDKLNDYYYNNKHKYYYLSFNTRLRKYFGQYMSPISKYFNTFIISWIRNIIICLIDTIESVVLIDIIINSIFHNIYCCIVSTSSSTTTRKLAHKLNDYYIVASIIGCKDLIDTFWISLLWFYVIRG